MSCKLMGNILFGTVYNVRIYGSYTEGLTDLEDNIMKQQCAANGSLWLFISSHNRPLLICVHIISTHLHSLSSLGTILEEGERKKKHWGENWLMILPAYSEILFINNLEPIHCVLICSNLMGTIHFECVGPDRSPFPSEWGVLYKVIWIIQQGTPFCFSCSLLSAVVLITLKVRLKMFGEAKYHSLVIFKSEIISLLSD